MRLPHVSVRLVAVLMLLAGGSLGVFAARTLWAGREEPVAPQYLNPAIDAKVRLYVSYYGLDAQKAEQIRLLLTEFDQRTLQLYRRLRAENPVGFEVLRDEIDAQIRDIIAPAGAAPAPRSR